ncbi:MAG: helix-turn-helix domain-containing protein [Archaeoglobaceae archaeon]
MELLKSLGKRQMTLTELSKELNISKPSAKAHLERLVEQGLVERVEEGRKWIYNELTTKGKQVSMQAES